MNRTTFGDALEALKAGRRVARAGWNGKGMWLALFTPNEQAGNEICLGVGWSAYCHPFIVMQTPNGVGNGWISQLVPWLASQTDMLAEDWQVL